MRKTKKDEVKKKKRRRKEAVFIGWDREEDENKREAWASKAVQGHWVSGLAATGKNETVTGG